MSKHCTQMDRCSSKEYPPIKIRYNINMQWWRRPEASETFAIILSVKIQQSSRWVGSLPRLIGRSVRWPEIKRKESLSVHACVVQVECQLRVLKAVTTDVEFLITSFYALVCSVVVWLDVARASVRWIFHTFNIIFFIQSHADGLRSLGSCWHT